MFCKTKSARRDWYAQCRIIRISLYNPPLFCPQHTAMNLTATTLLALSMSADAFAASLARGAGGGKTSLSQTVKTALTFGVVETATPLIGWAAGIVAAPYHRSV